MIYLFIRFLKYCWIITLTRLTISETSSLLYLQLGFFCFFGGFLDCSMNFCIISFRELKNSIKSEFFLYLGGLGSKKDFYWKQNGELHLRVAHTTWFCVCGAHSSWLPNSHYLLPSAIVFYEGLSFYSLLQIGKDLLI